MVRNPDLLGATVLVSVLTRAEEIITRARGLCAEECAHVCLRQLYISLPQI